MGGPGEQADSFAEQVESESVEQESVEAQWKHAEKKVYSENFGKGAGPEWSHRTVSRTPKRERKVLGPFSEQEVTLNLAGLPDHDEVEVQLELFVLQSWDGNDTTKGPGRWVASVDDGPVLLDATFSHLHCSHPGLTGASMKGTLGYRDESDDGSKGYTISPLSFTFRHTGDRLTLRFADPPRGEADEQWGLDSVKVKVRKKKGGDLLVSNNANSSVLRYDGKTGNFIDVFVPAGTGANAATLTFMPSKRNQPHEHEAD
ncbi:hypothetical protein [Myxococcus xanthus]|uniref:hypothetical protein n=1 Tax=Myxococcus xanthus TaxID=34 RepID=UPI001F29C236|nr:hypothetical protein [Myxococcus xanthus]